MSRRAIRLQDPYYHEKFRIFLNEVYAAGKTTHGPTRPNPIKSSMERLAQGKSDSTDQKYAKRIMRFVDQLIQEGIVEFKINEPSLFEKAPGLWNSLKNNQLPVDSSEERDLMKTLNEKGFQAKVFFDSDQLYKALAEDLVQAISRETQVKVMVGSGVTVGKLKEYFHPDKALLKTYSQRGNPLFLPSAGNFYPKEPLDAKEADYLYHFSPNANALALNSKLGLPSFFMDVPRVIERPKVNRLGEPLTVSQARRYLQMLKEYYQKSYSYLNVYSDPEVSTVLFSPGSSSGETPRLAYSSFLKKYDDQVSFKEVSTEIFLRFYNKAGNLIGHPDGKKFKLSDRMSQADVFTLFYYCYLGLKESYCRRIALNHRRNGAGLGSVVLVTNETKVHALSICLLKSEPIVNTIYILKPLLGRLHKELRSLGWPK